jgi:hypothetical protein
MKESKKGTLNLEDWKQISIKLVMVAVAAILPELVKQLQLVDFGIYQSVATTVIFVLSYIGQRLLQGK